MTGLLNGRRILVVEDEMMVLMSIETALEDLGCISICAAATVGEALGLIDRNRFDAAMLDVNLAGETSYPVADALAAHHIPFAFSTGCGDHGVRVDFEATPMLRKPYTRATLELVLRRLLPADPLPAAA